MAATANPAVKLPDLGPDPLNDHGAPRAASVPFMLTQDMKRRLRAYGYSDEEIAHLTPQQAHEILAREGPRQAIGEPTQGTSANAGVKSLALDLDSLFK